MLLLAVKMPLLSQAGLGGVYGLDTNYEVYYMDQLLNMGKWVVTSADTVNSYPLIHFLGSIFSMMASIKIYYITSGIMLLMDILTLGFFMLISKSLFKDHKVTLFSSLGFIFIYLFIYFAFGRMLISVFLFFLSIYLIVRFRTYVIPKILLVFSCILLVFSHPIAPIILMLFVIVVFLLNFLNNKNIINIVFKNSKDDSSFTMNINFLVILVVIIAAYFVYISIWEQAKFVTTLDMLTGLKKTIEVGMASESPLNWRIYLYGQGILAVIYSLIFIKYRDNVHNYNALILMTFGIFMGGLSIINYVLALELIRYTIFIWPAILLASNYVLLKSDKSKILSIMLILFVVINVSGYYADTYDKTYDRPFGQWRMHTTEQEEAAVLTMNTSGHIVSNQYFFMLIKKYSLKQNIVNMNPKYYVEDYKKKSNINYFYLEKEDLNNSFLRGYGPFRLPYNTYLDYFDNKHLAGIYDNGDVEVFKVT